MAADFSTVVLSGLLFNKEYSESVLPHLKPEFFTGDAEKKVFGLTKDFIDTYKSLPTQEAILHLIDGQKQSQVANDMCVAVVEAMVHERDATLRNDLKFLVHETESWARKQAVYHALATSVEIVDGTHKTLTDASIVQIMSDAINISFDTKIGHDFFDDAEARWDEIHTQADKIQCDLSCFNYITKGGFQKKTMFGVIAGTNVGKSFMLCHMTGSMVRNGYNVLYVSLEMSEAQMGNRIDANLMDVTTDDIEHMSKERYMERIRKVRDRCGSGRMIIKQYPSTSCTIRTIEGLLKELWAKKGFKPDVLVLDYLGIMSSIHVKDKSNLYVLGKSVAEEVRSLAIEHDLLVLTASQFNRGGNDNTEVTIKDIADSMGIAMTLDNAVALIRTEALDACGQMQCVQLKNRYMDMGKLPKFTLKADREKQRFYDADMPPARVLRHFDTEGRTIPSLPPSDSGSHRPLRSAYSKPKPDFKSGSHLSL